MTYAEFLKQNGATDEEIKVLDHAAARKAFEAMGQRIAEADRAKAAADQALAENQKWYDETAMPTLERMERERNTSRANEARVVELIKNSADDGLREVAKTMGYTVEGSTPPARKTTVEGDVPFDPKKYNLITMDEARSFLQAEGQAIAAMGRMVQEHSRLFPDGELVNWEDLRQEAVRTKKTVESLWMEKYGVQAARDKRSADAKAAEVAAIRADERKKADEEWANKFGNPDLRPMETSRSPFTTRKETGRDKQPWAVDGGAGTLERDRVSRATQHVMQQANKTN